MLVLCDKDFPNAVHDFFVFDRHAGLLKVGEDGLEYTAVIGDDFSTITGAHGF